MYLILLVTLIKSVKGMFVIGSVKKTYAADGVGEFEIDVTSSGKAKATLKLDKEIYEALLAYYVINLCFCILLFSLI